MITSQNGDGHGDGDTRQLMMWQVYAGQGRAGQVHAGQGSYMQGRACFFRHVYPVCQQMVAQIMCR